MEKRIRILLVDDHTVFRHGLASLLKAQPDLELRFHCGSVGEALLLLPVSAADVLLLDADLGAERGIDFLTQARRNGFCGPVLVLTVGVSQEEEILLRNYGISGILKKNASGEELALRIREAAGIGGVYNFTRAEPQRHGILPSNESQRALTVREAEVLAASSPG